MLVKHIREELEDARTKGWREEARLVSRNAIIAAAAALCPLGVIMGVLTMVLWDRVGNLPPLMSYSAFYYPVAGLLGIVAAVFLHSRRAYTPAMVVALLPLLCVPTFIIATVVWVVF